MENKFVAAALAIQTAESEAMRGLLEVIVRHIDLREIEGLPLAEWIQQRRRAELEKVLIGMENHDAGAAAAVQSLLDSIPRPPNT